MGKQTSFTIQYPEKKDTSSILRTPAIPLNEIGIIKYQNSKWYNQIIWGDNLPVMANLIADFKGKIKLIYIDPPFATKSTFHHKNNDHAYDDHRVGAEFIEFLRERLILLYQLLSEDGSIYVHLDNKMAFEIKIIMDEIFGADNFRNWITRKKCNRKNYTKNQYGNISDYILFYTKSDNYTWNRPSDQWLDDDIAREFPCIENETGRRFKKVPIHAPGIRNGETGKPWKGLMPPEGKHWQYTPSKLDILDKNGEIYWSSTGNPRRKHYFDDDSALPVQDIWMDFKDITNQNTIMTGYPTEKNPLLLDRIITASSDEGDIVLDCFSGSGTTIARAEKLKRKWIGIDNSITAIKTALHRITVGSKAMKDFGKNTKSDDLLFDLNTNPELIHSNLRLLAASDKDLSERLDLETTFNALVEIVPQASLV